MQLDQWTALALAFSLGGLTVGALMWWLLARALKRGLAAQHELLRRWDAEGLPRGRVEQ